MQAEANILFTQIHTQKGIKLFCERDIFTMIKEFKKLDEGEMQVNPVVITLNPDERIYAKSRQAL